MNENKRGKTDMKMVLGIIIMVIIFGFIGGSFWNMVGKEAEKIRKEEAVQEDEAISAIYIETGEFFKLQMFADLENGMTFTAHVPAEGIYSKNGKLVEGDTLELGDTVKIYGDGIMTRSEPAKYPGVTKMVRTGRASLEDTQRYLDEVEKRYGTDTQKQNIQTKDTK